MASAVLKNSLRAAACTTALAGVLLAGGAPVFAAPAAPASPDSAQALICRYSMEYGSGIYPDQGGRPATSTNGSIPQGSVVTAYKDITWSSSVGVVYRKLSSGSWAIDNAMVYVPNQTCFS